jgi:type II secretory pathway component PulK
MTEQMDALLTGYALLAYLLPLAVVVTIGAAIAEHIERRRERRERQLRMFRGEL